MEGTWKKSSYSNGGEANCVETLRSFERLSVRDSKAPSCGILLFADQAADAWLAAVKAGKFDR